MQGPILLADDTRSVRETTKILLENLTGLEVLTFTNGEELVEGSKRLQGKYRLIISDLTMPKMNGFAATSAIREFDPITPICIHSSHTLEHYKQKAREVGATHYIVKGNFYDTFPEVLKQCGIYPNKN